MVLSEADYSHYKNSSNNSVYYVGLAETAWTNKLRIVVKEIVKLNWVTQTVLDTVGLGCGE